VGTRCDLDAVCLLESDPGHPAHSLGIIVTAILAPVQFIKQNSIFGCS
jgi:hypothetical protein